MPVTIDATAGGASANSFVTQADATTYLEGRLNSSAWDDATTDEKNRALVEATRELTSQSWAGTRASSTQALSWPRQWVYDPDATVDGLFYDTDEIPQRVVDATCELALEFLKAGTTDIAALPAADGIVQKTVDVLSTTYAEPSQRRDGLLRFPRVYRLVAPLLASSAGTMRVVRG